MIKRKAKEQTIERCLQQQDENEWEQKCLITEVKKQLSHINQDNANFNIPEFFTKCHAKRSIALLVEGRHIFASKQILKLASPVFHSMFESDFLEKDMESIELPGKTCQEVILLLSCIYPNILEQIEDDDSRPAVINIKSLSPAASRAADKIKSYSSKCIQVINCFGTAQELQIFFRKLNVAWITIHNKSRTARVLFEDETSSLCAYCMNGELFKGKRIHVTYTSEFETTPFEDESDDADETDNWKQTNYLLNAQDKLPLLLKLADEYQMDSVLRLCDEKYLLMYQQQSQEPGFSEVKLVELMLIAEQYQLQTLLNALIKTAVDDMTLAQLEGCKRFEELTLEMRYKIVNAKLNKFKQRGLYAVSYSRELPSLRRRIRRQCQSNDCSAFFLSGESPLMTLVIKIGSKKLFASKEVLALSSPVLDEKITALSKSMEMVTLKFEDQNFDDFLCLLRSIHPGTVLDISDDNVQRLLDLAYDLEVDKLAEDCDEFLDIEFNKVMSTLMENRSDEKSKAETANKYLNKAAHYRLPQLLDSCCDYLSKIDVEKLLGKELKVSKTIMLKIISKRVNGLESSYSRPYYYGEDQTATYLDTQSITEIKESPQSIHSFKEKLGCNVRLVVQDKEYYADEDILCIASPVLKHKLQSTDGGGNTATISLDMNEMDFLIILRCIYPNILERVTASDAIKVLTFTEEYKMTSFRKLCERSLVKHCHGSKLSSSTIVDYITKASLFQMPRLKQACEGVLRNVYREMDPKHKYTSTSSVDLSRQTGTSASALAKLFIQVNENDDFYDYDDDDVDDIYE